MQYELRPLNSNDLFPMFGILSKIGFKEFKNVITKENIDAMKGSMNGEEDATTLGASIMVEVASIIIANIGNCKDDINAFLSSVSGLKKKEIESMPIADYAQMIIDVVRKEEFKDFFKVVSKLFN